MSEFYSYFKENMDYLNLAAPDTLFGSSQLAQNAAMTIVGFVEKFGARVTVRELALAGTGMERLLVVGTCSAMYYAGAVVGSLAVATGRSLSNGVSLADVIFMAKQQGLHREWRVPVLQRSHVNRGPATKVFGK